MKIKKNEVKWSSLVVGLSFLFIALNAYSCGPDAIGKSGGGEGAGELIVKFEKIRAGGVSFKEDILTLKKKMGRYF